MSEPYSPLRYPGGKAKLSSFLTQVIAYNGLSEPRYVEPYAGGAGAALQLLFEEYVESIVINDIDPRVRCFWQAVTEYNEAFLELLDNVDVTVDEWRRQRSIYERCDLRSVLRLGFSTFFLNRTTRSGIVHNGGPIGGYDQKGNYKINARFNREQLARRIQRIGIYSERIDVSGEDGLSILHSIQSNQKSSQNILVYLDPPYYVKGSELYLNTFSHNQHENLRDYLREPKSFPWILTYDNTEPIRNLYSGFPQLCFNLSYSAYQRRQGQELLIYPSFVKIPPKTKIALPVAA